MTIGNNKELLMLMFDAFLENSHDLIFVKDINLNYVGASRAFANLVGLENADRLIGKSDFDIFNDDLAKRYTSDDKKVLESGVSIVDNVEPLPDKYGKKSYSSTSKYIIKDKTGKTVGIYGIGRDVTAEIELEEERERRELSRQMFEDVLEADITENRMMRAEGFAWSRSLELSKDSTFSETVEILASSLIHKDYSEEFKNFYSIDNLVDGYEKGIREFSHITYQKSDGSNYKWMECNSKLYHSKISNTLRIATFWKDLDDEIRDKEKLILKAETDALTGLLNRESVIKNINECISGEGCDKTHALMFIDLDCFKLVNDNLGHSFGDKVLKEIAEKLKHLFSENDIVGRVGGDEFLVFLSNIDSKDVIEKKAKEIFNTGPFYQFKNNQEIFVTCSIGVSMYNADGKTLGQLYEEADQAMYRAKKGGKNRLSFY